jgi:hypothetical protein
VVIGTDCISSNLTAIRSQPRQILKLIDIRFFNLCMHMCKLGISILTLFL